MQSVTWAVIWLAMTLVAIPTRSSERIAVAGKQGDPAPVRILDSGIAVVPPIPGVTPPDAPRTSVIALRVDNPNANLAAEGLRLDVHLLDHDGAPVMSLPIDVAQLLPSEHRNVVVELELSPAQVDAVAVVAGTVAGPSIWRRVDMVPLPIVQLQSVSSRVLGLSSINVVNPAPEGPVGTTFPVAAATITNPLDVSFPEMNVAAVALDHEGRIISAGQWTQALAPGESASVRVGMVPVPVDTISRLEVTAAYPRIDLAPYAR